MRIWGKYSTALAAGNAYSELPRTVVISITDFSLFDCVEFHSEYRVLEVTRHTLLTDRFCMHYYELPKLPDEITEDSELNIWLMLFKAKTIEDFKRLEDLEVPFVEQTIEAYRSITATSEFKELERMRALARHNEASALKYAREQGLEQGREQEREIWQVVVADKDVVIAVQKVENEKKDVALAEKDAALAEKDTALAEKEALINELMARLGEKK